MPPLKTRFPAALLEFGRALRDQAFELALAPSQVQRAQLHQSAEQSQRQQRRQGRRVAQFAGQLLRGVGWLVKRSKRTGVDEAPR